MAKRLLIVHSDLTYAQELSYSFEADGYLLFTAKNIKEGLENFQIPFDALITTRYFLTGCLGSGSV